MTKKIFIGVLVVVVLAIGFLTLHQPADLNASGTGPNHTQTENFFQGLFAGTGGQLRIGNTGAVTDGGTVLSISTGTTLTVPQECNLALVAYASATNASAITLPAAASMNTGCLTADGMVRSFRINNTASTTLSFTTSTGDKFSKSGSASSTLTLSSSTFSFGTMTVIRINSTTDNYSLSQFQTGT